MPLDWLEGDPEFFIDHIVSHRVFKVKKKLMIHYLIHWHGFDSSHESHEPRETVPTGQTDIFNAYDLSNDLNVSSTGSLPNFIPAPIYVPLSIPRPVSHQHVTSAPKAPVDSRPLSKRRRVADPKNA